MTVSDPQSISFITRLLLAGVLGALIGLERELRAKEAGLRTHFLVALGSALIMMVSQWGFGEATGASGTTADRARVAAQIVSGIGFIGAGAIMVQKHYVLGLTTAAGLWVVAGIGMAAGGGLWPLAVASTIFALIGLELFRFIVKLVRLTNVNVTFSAEKASDIPHMLSRLKDAGFHVFNYKVESVSSVGGYRIVASMREKKKGDSKLTLIRLFNYEEGVSLKSIE